MLVVAPDLPIAVAGLQQRLTLMQLSSCLKLAQVTFVPRDSNSENYKKLNYQWNTFNYIEPMGYIVPENTVQVQGTIKCTRSLNVSIAIKSGGHSYEKYSFGDGNSVVIDLQKLNTVKVNRRRSTANVGAGVLGAQLSYYIWKNGNFVTPTGMCISVSYGGVALGGGYSWLSPKFGMVADSLLEMEVVTAAGAILRVDSLQNQDLFWALRGGGGNFGIVTNFKTRIFNAADLRYTIVVLKYPLTQTSALFDAMQKFCLKYQRKSVALIGGVLNTGIIIWLFDTNLSQDDMRQYIQEFPPPSSQSVNTFSNFPEVVLYYPVSANVSKVSDLKHASRLVAVPVTEKVKSYYVRKVVGNNAIQNLSNVLARIPPSYEFYILSNAGAINKIPKSETAFVHRNAIYYIELKIFPDRPGGMAPSWNKDFQAAISNVEDGESFQNMIDGTLPDYLQRYYASNLQRLRRIKTKYDPTSYFNYPQSIPPLKISRGKEIFL